YTNTFSYAGGSSYGNVAGQTLWLDSRRFGNQSDVDTIVDPPGRGAATKSNIFGFFVQGNWSIMDKVTLNVCLRWDSLTLQGSDGITRISLHDQWSPRVGVVWDPTQQGRSKIYANYGRYYENIPLDIVSRSSSPQTQILGIHTCRPGTRDLRGACDA